MSTKTRADRHSFAQEGPLACRLESMQKGKRKSIFDRGEREKKIPAGSRWGKSWTDARGWC
jgi:hypothetical protein